MRPASVGFQCPECVAEGRKSQRVGRTAFGGKVHARDTLVTVSLIAVNVVIFLVVTALGPAGDQLVLELSMLSGEVPLRGIGPDSGVAAGEFWRIITSSFVHTGFLHLLFNMVAIGFIGPNLERVLGRWRYLALFLLSCLTAGTAVYWLSPPAALTYGASGGVFGLLAAALVVYRKQGYDVSALLLLLGVNLFFTFSVPNISWQGHIGGLVGGLITAAALAYAPRRGRTALHSAAFVGLTVLCVALIAARSFMLS
ncbi:MAG TPA: rhomboid family intramembrane serine protease [Nocardioidaceae bacterium]|nr:rhomboid family intramembrane serine protease [Nocardioidaceae bacterium]